MKVKHLIIVLSVVGVISIATPIIVTNVINANNKIIVYEPEDKIGEVKQSELEKSYSSYVEDLQDGVADSNGAELQFIEKHRLYLSPIDTLTNVNSTDVMYCYNDNAGLWDLPHKDELGYNLNALANPNPQYNGYYIYYID